MFRDGEARVVAFHVGAERFAVELAAVDEVLDLPALRAMPDMPRAVLGLATIRGEPTTMYDAGALLEVTAAIGGTALVFRCSERRIGLVVGDVDEAFIVQEDAVRAAPGAESSNGMLMGVIRRGADLVALLDARALVDAAASTIEVQRT
ncbi:MAG TPA: chemotaxis protein CheW [Gemmatimonadaceae bacterium]|nr:chemotaxis protein CheW [Gemmatimonadaceae bacterium]